MRTLVRNIPAFEIPLMYGGIQPERACVHIRFNKCSQWLSRTHAHKLTTHFYTHYNTRRDPRLECHTNVRRRILETYLCWVDFYASTVWRARARVSWFWYMMFCVCVCLSVFWCSRTPSWWWRHALASTGGIKCNLKVSCGAASATTTPTASQYAKRGERVAGMCIENKNGRWISCFCLSKCY